MTPKRIENGYQRGLTDAKLEAVAAAVNEIKVAIIRIDERLDSLRMWRAKLIGIAVAFSVVAAFINRLVARLLGF